MCSLAVFLTLVASIRAGVSAVGKAQSQTRDELFPELTSLLLNSHETEDKTVQTGLREYNSYITNPNTCQCTCNYNAANENGPGPTCPNYFTNCGGWHSDFFGRPRDCQELYQRGYTKTRVYIIFPVGVLEGIFVLCDMVTDGGGWTAIQKRVNRDVDFYRDWVEYKRGFGDLNANFWLGNDNIFALTSQDNYQLLIELAVSGANNSYAKYNSFKVGDESSGYLLTVGGYSGTAGDSFSAHSGAKFSTKDRDNDIHVGDCAEANKGAWWYTACHQSNLNGVYGSSVFGTGINWYSYAGHYTSMTFSNMKVRKLLTR